MSESGEVTAAEIARLVGVGRAAVSNWRRRYLDFPKPVGGPPNSPTFSWLQIEAWLRANNRLNRPVAQGTQTQKVQDGLTEPPDDQRLAEAMVGLMPLLETGLVLDPACASGWLLRAALAHARAGVGFAAQDVDAGAIEVVRDLFDEACRRPVALDVGDPFEDDALAEFRLGSDIVLCAPPIGSLAVRPIPLEELTYDARWEFGLPAASDPVGAWVQMCYSYLKPDGVAIVAVPAAAVSKASGRRIRAELVRAGALRTVVGLPQRFAGRHSSVQIWVLQRPSGPPARRVRMIDLGDAEPDEVPTRRAEWEQIYGDPARCRDVLAIDLLDEEVALTPARYIQPPISDISSSFQRTNAELTSLLTRAAAEIPSFASCDPVRDFPMIGLMDLARAGAVELIGRDGGVRSGDIVIPVSPGGAPPLVVQKPDDLEYLDSGRSILEILRCDPEQLDPYFVVGFLQSELNRRQSRGTLSSSQRLAVRRVRIPRIPLTEQRQYGAAFRRISEWTELLRTGAQLGETSLGLAIHGLTSGVLEPLPNLLTPEGHP